MKQGSILAVLGALVGCMADPPRGERVDVTEPNALGVTTVEVTQADDGTLRIGGLDAAGVEVASYQHRIGDIAGLGEHLPGRGDRGLDQIITVQGQTWHGMSRETLVPSVAELSASPEYRGFFDLTAVREALGTRHVLIHVTKDVPVPSTAEVKLYTADCNASDLNNSPSVAQCC